MFILQLLFPETWKIQIKVIIRYLMGYIEEFMPPLFFLPVVFHVQNTTFL